MKHWRLPVWVWQVCLLASFLLSPLAATWAAPMPGAQWHDHASAATPACVSHGVHGGHGSHHMPSLPCHPSPSGQDQDPVNPACASHCLAQPALAPSTAGWFAPTRGSGKFSDPSPLLFGYSLEVDLRPPIDTRI